MGSVELRNAVTLGAGRAGHSSDGDAAADVGDGHGDGGGVAAGGRVFGVCEGHPAREAAAALGVEGPQSQYTTGIGVMQDVHNCPMYFPCRAEVHDCLMLDEYALLFSVAERYVKTGGPPAQPPGWLRPPARQSGGTAALARRKKRVGRGQDLAELGESRLQLLVGQEASSEAAASAQ